VTFNDFFHYYATYLQGTTSTSDTNIASDIRFRTAKVFQCPDKPIGLGYGYSYMIAAASVTDWKLTRTTLASLGSQYEKYMPNGPALFADIIQAANGNPAYTCHFDMSKQRAAGGNVVHLDGSVAWYDFLGFGVNPPVKSYPAYYGPGSLGATASFAWPSSALVILTDGNGYLSGGFHLVHGSNWNCIFATGYQYSDVLLPENGG
jgi:hypothetical protein